MIVPAKLLHENSSKLLSILTAIGSVSNAFRDLADLRAGLQNQSQTCDQLRDLARQVQDILTHGNDLLRQPMVPKYVQQDLQVLQKTYNEKLQAAQEFLVKLKVKRSNVFFETN